MEAERVTPPESKNAKDKGLQLSEVFVFASRTLQTVVVVEPCPLRWTRLGLLSLPP